MRHETDSGKVRHQVEDMENLLKHASSKHGPVSLWVNNAGVEVETSYKPFGKKVILQESGQKEMVARCYTNSPLFSNLAALQRGLAIHVCMLVSPSGEALHPLSHFLPLPLPLLFPLQGSRKPCLMPVGNPTAGHGPFEPRRLGQDGYSPPPGPQAMKISTLECPVHKFDFLLLFHI